MLGHWVLLHWPGGTRMTEDPEDTPTLLKKWDFHNCHFKTYTFLCMLK